MTSPRDSSPPRVALLTAAGSGTDAAAVLAEERGGLGVTGSHSDPSGGVTRSV